MRMKPSIFVESTARCCCFRSEVIKLSQWFLWSDFHRRFWLDNGHSWWYVSALFDIIDTLTIFLCILERIIDVMKWCFLFVVNYSSWKLEHDDLIEQNNKCLEKIFNINWISAQLIIQSLSVVDSYVFYGIFVFPASQH